MEELQSTVFGSDVEGDDALFDLRDESLEALVA